MINDLKILLGITDSSQDTLLQLILNRVIDEAKIYTNNNDIHRLRNVILQMATFQYNQITTQKSAMANLGSNAGIKQETYSSVSFTYEDTASVLDAISNSGSYPVSIMNQLKACRKVGVIRD